MRRVRTIAESGGHCNMGDAWLWRMRTANLWPSCSLFRPVGGSARGSSMQGAQPAARSTHAAVAATFTEQKVNSAATCMGYCGAQCHCAAPSPAQCYWSMKL
jgi:hypothetical protein